MTIGTHFEALFGPNQWTADWSPGGVVSNNSLIAFPIRLHTATPSISPASISSSAIRAIHLQVVTLPVVMQVVRLGGVPLESAST